MGEQKHVLYRIRIAAHLDQAWSEWFDRMDITYAEGGDTLFTGALMDQAMLHGVLAKLRDLGLPLVSVTRVHDVGQAEE